MGYAELVLFKIAILGQQKRCLPGRQNLRQVGSAGCVEVKTIIMLKLENIQEPVRNHMIAFEPMFKTAMQSNVALLDIVMRYVVKRKGKQIRPLFVFLTAGLCGEINDSTYRGATLIELLHTATLIHDDVVDDSNERRGFFSLTALIKLVTKT